MNRLYLLIVTILLLSPGTSLAQQNTPLSADGKFYGRLSSGAIMPTDTGYSISGSVTGFGLTATGTVSGEVKAKTGHTIDGVIGYRVNNFLSIEAQFGHAQFDLDTASVNVDGTITSGGSSLSVNASTDLSLDGDVSAFTGLVNVIASVPELGSLRPYVGAGIGFVDWEIELNSISQGGTTLTVNGKEDGTDLTANFIAGIDYAISKTWSVGGRYRYVWTDTGTEISDDVTAHVLQASVNISF